MMVLMMTIHIQVVTVHEHSINNRDVTLAITMQIILITVLMIILLTVTVIVLQEKSTTATVNVMIIARSIDKSGNAEQE